MNRVLVYPIDNALLRRKAKRIKNIQDPSVIIAVQTMKAVALDWEQETGQRCEGLAATQIGIALRILMVRQTDMQVPRNPDRIHNNVEFFGDGDEGWDAYCKAVQVYTEFNKAHPGFDPWYVMYNPVFMLSEGMQESTEACLSVPGKVGKTMRPEKIVFHHYDANGKRVPDIGPDPKKPGELVATEFSAACITHELDHLNGVLWIDSAFEVRDWVEGDKAL